MKEAIIYLAENSLDGYIGEVDVSRESNGAGGLQAYRCGRDFFCFLPGVAYPFMCSVPINSHIPHR